MIPDQLLSYIQSLFQCPLGLIFDGMKIFCIIVPKMNCILKSNGHEHSPKNRLSSRSFILSRGLRPYLCRTFEKTFSRCGTQAVYIYIYIYVYIYGDCVAILCQYRRCLRFQTPQVSSYSSGFHGNSEAPGPFLPLRVSSYSCPSLHLFAAHENSTLRLDEVLSPQVHLYSSNHVDRVP